MSIGSNTRSFSGEVDDWLTGGKGKRTSYSESHASSVSRSICHPIAEMPQRHSDMRRCWSLSLSKRIVDIAVSILALAVSAVPMLLIAILIRLSSKGRATFVQHRVGMKGRHFPMYKFRSMTACEGKGRGPNLTRDGDVRITGLGRWLRKFKLDELPQFYNVFRGDMSLVGPRPKLPQYAEKASLQFRPGLTGAATLAFRCEEEILKQVHPDHLDSFYLHSIKPLKERIDVRYMRTATLWSDLGLIFETFRVAFVPARIPGSFKNLGYSNVLMPEAERKTGTDGASDWQRRTGFIHFNHDLASEHPKTSPFQFGDITQGPATDSVQLIERV